MDSPGSHAAAPNRDSQSYNEAQNHPLTAPMLHNAARSLLASLPDKILLRIMSHADDIDLFCLRRTCRTMLRLFSDPSFLRLHDDSADVDERSESRTFGHCRMDNGLYVWPRKRGAPCKRELLTEAPKKALRELLLRDMYCETCRNVDPAVEKRLRTEMLYSSGCKESHPAGLFSYAERHKGDAEARQCIGRQGRIRASLFEWARSERGGAAYIFGPARRNEFRHEMIPFDPNYCSFTRRCPTHRAEVNWEEQGKTLDQSRWLQKAHIWISYLLRCNYSPQECIAMRYVKWIPLGECNTSVGSRFPQLLSRLWSIMTFTSPRQEPIRFPGGKTQPWSAAWFMALDPESYELRDDVESRGVY
ncbi:hypothetical protein QBC37DRAFT_466322 [Rhypophila decipiens]|uniref:F-box domain-containing protein n=1 Tax=Rhypophila decipiens TaxID=261697 RepID=A0AAN6Y3V4_9PEZI|nr:hypothetical protein QBC37DRAFT_466322 [Rhypophila decipiens]